MVGAFVLTPTPANAQAFGPGACGGGCFYADNPNETFYYYNLTVGSINAMEFARTNRLEPTVMTTQLQTSSFNGDTDVLVYDATYSTNPAYAWWQCDALVGGSSTKCNQGHITINTRYTPLYAMACQEIGHAVGLDHSASTGSCMWQDSRQATNYYDTHDKGHINGYYN